MMNSNKKAMNEITESRSRNHLRQNVLYIRVKKHLTRIIVNSGRPGFPKNNQTIRYVLYVSLERFELNK